MKKANNRPNFKRGDRVLYFTDGYYALQVWDAEVTAIRQQPEGHWLVYTKSQGNLTDGYWTKRFSTNGIGFTAGSRGHETEPIWKLRPFTSADDFKNLKKRTEIASRRFRAYRDAETQMERDVQTEARQWEADERERRREGIPDRLVLKNTLARMGFKQPPRR